MSTGTQTCDVVIPGYTLTERIGSGGYAEVWRAEAPGGIEKAAKIVYGYYDDEFAAQELKALERIKGVRHPFLLSLERFDVVGGRLTILTELADMSLDRRLRECRAAGLPGIPRQELLRYMADAAEALDFLALRHNLLHLDIKPENLLILGDHIKVADFGLVKELATRTQNSLVSGMTPTYASPEMFDDEPSAQSDQYSLAIVYQEMLVGSLPFPGRTAAQLAKQHTQAEPQLMPLPPDDRPVVARALAKQPVARYPSCRAFVDALMQRADSTARSVVPEMPRPIPAVPPTPAPAPDDTKPPSFCTTIRRQELPRIEPAPGVTQPVKRNVPATPTPADDQQVTERHAPEEVVDVSVPEINEDLGCEQPTLYIAAGGVGIQLLCRLRTLISHAADATQRNRAIEAIALDTDRNELREACSARWPMPLDSDDTLHLPLRLPQSYDNSREILGWVSRRWLYNIPRSLETRGYRPLGRVALVDHAERVCALVDRKLKNLAGLVDSTSATGAARNMTLRAVLLAGTGGGTGAGVAIDLANAVRSLAASRNLPVEVHGIFVFASFSSSSSSPLAAANSYSLLAELNHATICGNVGPGESPAPAKRFESPRPPFDAVYWVPLRQRPRGAYPAESLETAAKYLALEENAVARAVLRSCRTSPTPREKSSRRGLLIRKFGCASLADQKRRFTNELAAELAAAIKRHWLTSDTSANWERLVRKEQQAAQATKPSPNAEANTDAPGAPPTNDTTPLALRARFERFMSLEFTSEVVLQLHRLLESRDERGRPRLVPREAKILADAAAATVAALAEKHDTAATQDRLEASPVLQPLIAAGGRRVLSQLLERLDFKQSDCGLAVAALDESLRAESSKLIEEALEQPQMAAAIASLVDVAAAAAGALDAATSDLLQCGGDRRTLVFVPQHAAEQNAAAEKLQSLRPLAAIVPAPVDDVLIICEESAISPHSLAAGLERVFPGIGDAGRRLCTRIDIEWQKLA